MAIKERRKEIQLGEELNAMFNELGLEIELPVEDDEEVEENETDNE